MDVVDRLFQGLDAEKVKVESRAGQHARANKAAQRKHTED
jgi:hypothetical protein